MRAILLEIENDTSYFCQRHFHPSISGASAGGAAAWGGHADDGTTTHIGRGGGLFRHLVQAFGLLLVWPLFVGESGISCTLDDRSVDLVNGMPRA